jgi:hypothetical protein
MRLRHLRALPEIDTPSNRASHSETSTKADSKYPDLERGVDQCPNWAEGDLCALPAAPRSSTPSSIEWSHSRVELRDLCCGLARTEISSLQEKHYITAMN